VCGILLYIDYENGVDLDRFKQALDLQTHRGPDEEGVYVAESVSSKLVDIKYYNSNKPFLAVGHKRLKIIDLTSESIQPVVDSTKTKFMSYNGEIYNFKDYVSSKTTNSDTLTLFHSLNHNSIEILNKFNGMWGIVYGDLISGNISIARDRYGKKPIYYFKSRNKLIISSEIKSIFHILAIKRKVNQHLLSKFIIGRLTPYPIDSETFYSDISSIAPGEVLNFDIRKREFTQNYKIGFDKFYEDISLLTKDHLIEKLKSDIDNAVRLRLQSDVKVGILVSGGIDSSAIVGSIIDIQQRDIEFYTCQIVDKTNNITNDLHYARKFSKAVGIDLNEIIIESLSDNELLNILLSIAKYNELPTNYLLASVPTYLIARSMRENGVGVAIDGIGGDEIFGGYPSYQSLANAAFAQGKIQIGLYYANLWLRSMGFSIRDFSRFTIVSLLSVLNKKIYDGYDRILKDSKSLIKNDLHDDIDTALKHIRKRNILDDRVERQKYEIERNQLPFYLGTADSLNMASSIENRSPFLDVNLHKYINIPNKFIFDKGFSKSILRQSMHQKIPDYIRWRKDKSGIRGIFNAKKLQKLGTLELMYESSFVNSILKNGIDKKAIMKNQDLYNNLFSLAVLDINYGLSL